MCCFRREPLVTCCPWCPQGFASQSPLSCLPSTEILILCPRAEPSSHPHGKIQRAVNWSLFLLGGTPVMSDFSLGTPFTCGYWRDHSSTFCTGVNWGLTVFPQICQKLLRGITFYSCSDIEMPNWGKKRTPPSQESINKSLKKIIDNIHSRASLVINSPLWDFV